MRQRQLSAVGMRGGRHSRSTAGALLFVAACGAKVVVDVPADTNTGGRSAASSSSVVTVGSAGGGDASTGSFGSVTSGGGTSGCASMGAPCAGEWDCCSSYCDFDTHVCSTCKSPGAFTDCSPEKPSGCCGGCNGMAHVCVNADCTKNPPTCQHDYECCTDVCLSDSHTCKP